MKSILILSATACIAAILYVIWPSPASAQSLPVPPECKSLKSDLEQTRVLEEIHRKIYEASRDYVKQAADSYRDTGNTYEEDCELDCIDEGRSHGSSLAFLGRTCQDKCIKAQNTAVSIFKRNLVAALIRMDGEKSAFNDNLKHVDYVTSELQNCIAEAKSRKQERVREAKKQLERAKKKREEAADFERARRKAARARKPRTAHRDSGVVRSANEDDGRMDAAAGAAAVGTLIGILNGAGVFNGHHGGGAGSHYHNHSGHHHRGQGCGDYC